MFCWRRLRGSLGIARVLKIVHFFEARTTLARVDRKHSCTFGQKWYLTVFTAETPRKPRARRKGGALAYQRADGTPRSFFRRERADAINIEASFCAPAGHAFRNRGAELLVEEKRVLRKFLGAEGFRQVTHRFAHGAK
jgi:hypothetical protein